MKKICFRRAAGEFIGAAIIIPLLLLIIMFIFNMAQIAICEERLTFAAYEAGRAAAISFSEEEASSAAKGMLDKIYNGTGATYGMKLQRVSGPDWVKGAFLLIEVQEDLSTFLGYQSGIHARRLAMMIEHSYWAKESLNVP